ncbi:MAG TPA: NifB/NifX family molybdenum-iron cluster-binding protein [Spirochaetia bacterium]|nr:NifB/NifX family molybdenum-iron cluster-binding protein [Spirochaetia bacterium]
MKLAISISGHAIDSQFDARFGRAAAYCIVDTESGEWTVHENPALSASGGAGVQAAQFVAKLGAKAVVSGAFGPNASSTLQAAEIEMYVAPTDHAATAAEVVSTFKTGGLTKTTGATNEGHHDPRRDDRSR